jgi:hypothetical protein
MKQRQSQHRADTAHHQTAIDAMSLHASRKSPSKLSFSAAC